MKRGLLTLSILAALNTPHAWAEIKRDPFAPFFGGSSAEEGTVAGKEKELTEQPVMAYRLIGLVASEKASRAIVQTKGNKTYILKPGDALGKEGGVIKDIKTDGISVLIGSETVELSVSNKIVPQAKKEEK